MTNIREQVPAFSIRYLNITTLMGMIVFCMSSLAYYSFISSLTRNSLIVFDRDLGFTKGNVISKTETSFIEGGEIFHYPVSKVMFIYHVDNMTFTNAGYTASDNIREGDELSISYKMSNPNISKAATLKGSPYGLYVLAGIFLPACGLFLFLKGLRWGNRFVSLLKNGTVTNGQLLKVVGDGEDYKHYYLYQDGNGKSRRVVFEASDKKAEENVRVLYDQDDLEKAEVLNLDGLPVLFARKKIRRILNCS